MGSVNTDPARLEDPGSRPPRGRKPAEVEEVFGVAGFRSLVAQRYVMYYRHELGSIFRALSRRGIVPLVLVRAGWRAVNALIGRAGNKLVVVAEREDQ